MKLVSDYKVINNQMYDIRQQDSNVLFSPGEKKKYHPNDEKIMTFDNC